MSFRLAPIYTTQQFLKLTRDTTGLFQSYPDLLMQDEVGVSIEVCRIPIENDQLRPLLFGDHRYRCSGIHHK